MKKALQKSLALALLLGISAAAQAQERVYVIDQRDNVVTSGFGLCWRTGYWTPAAAANDPAGCQCDRDLMPANKCSGVAPTTPGERPTTRTVDGKITLAADALFDFNKAVLRPEGRTKLDEVAAKGHQINLEVIIAVGHTDRIGGSAYNQRLSEQRAAAVKQYLVSKGIAADRVYTEGRGKTQPVTGTSCNNLGREHASNKKLVDCLQPDRRVDIELIGTNR